jgi:hypothetical protein
MKPKTTYLKETLEEVFPIPIPWKAEIFESRLEELLVSDLTNMERCILRLRSDQARTDNDARYLLKSLRLLLPELFDEKLMAEIAKETLS